VTTKAATVDQLLRRLAEAEATIAALVAGQVDAVVDAASQTPVLLSKAQEALSQSEERYRRIVETTNEGILTIDGDRLITFVNPRFVAMLGYPAEQLIGQPIVRFLPGTTAAVAAHQRRIEQARRGEFEENEVEFVRPDGTLLSTILSTSPIRDAAGDHAGTLAMITDNTRRNQTEEALRKSVAELVEQDARFRQLADAIREVFFLVDPQVTQIYYVSPAYEAIFGQSCGALYANPRAWIDLTHPDDRARVLDQIAPHGTVVPFDIEFRITRPDGASRSIRARAFPIYDAAGVVCRFAGVADDITERTTLEGQVRQAGKMDAIGRLASGVAHDFNNLLTVILGFTELVTADADISAQHGADLGEIIKAAQRAAALTRQLLAFSRQQVLRAAPVDVNALITDMTGMLARLIGENIQIELALGAAVPMAIVDRGQLEQVVMNLVVNARDAMPDGGTLMLETSYVDLENSSFHEETVAHGSYVMLAITDTGVGMPPDVQRRLFEPFFTTKEAGKGTGLGLSTTYGIVKQSKGYIWVYSEPGRGTTFKVYLPQASRDLPAERAPAPARAAVKTVSETVLLVEDEAGVRKLAKRILDGAGYRVLEAADGAEAEKLFAEHAGSIDLLVTDVVMPGIGGPELLRRLQDLAPTLRVLYMSGYTEQSAARIAGIDRGEPFVQKPFRAAELLHFVRQGLDR
jgi:two-component system, cell cycle sensor histidine kinase and response regulator CckA